MLCKVFWNKFLQSFTSYGIIPLVGAQIYTEDSETVHRQHLAERTGLEPARQLPAAHPLSRRTVYHSRTSPNFCDQSRIRTYAEVSLISFADCPFRPLAHLVK